MEQTPPITPNSETTSTGPSRRVVVKRPPPPPAPEAPKKECCMSAHCGTRWIVAVVVAFIFLAYVATAGFPMGWSRSKSWQAVFLTNGQVYFGRIVRDSTKTIVLRDVYYLQTTPALQQGEQPAQPDVTLVKLGNELHAPTDEMRINREHVLFTESLKDTGTVAQAIVKAREPKPAVTAPVEEPVSATGGSASGGNAPATTDGQVEENP